MKKNILKILSGITLAMLIFSTFFPTINYAYTITEDKLEENVELEQEDRLEENVELEQEDKSEENVKLDQEDKLEENVELDQEDKIEERVELDQEDKIEERVELVQEEKKEENIELVQENKQDENIELVQENKQDENIELEQEDETKENQLNEVNNVEVQKITNNKIEDGNYYIESALATNKVISVAGGKYNNFANVHLWDNIKKEYQKFNITYDTDINAYTITALHSNKSLDVSYARQENGANVAQYDTHKDKSEQWIIKEAGDGYYYIISKCNYLYFDVEAGQIGNGTNIQMYEGNGTKAQKFKFIKIENDERTQTIENGVYNITSQIDNNKVLYIDGKNEKVKITDKSDLINKTQEFKVEYLNNGYYAIITKDGYNLEVENGLQTNCAKIVQKPVNDKLTTQQWIIKETADGYYNIISRCNGLYIDIPGGKPYNNPIMNMYEGNGTNAQKFNFTKVEELKSDKIEDGIYYIESSLSQNKVISIEEGKYNNFANAHLWDNLKKGYQKFEFKYNADSETYTITALHSNKSLDVSYARQENGANVAQYDTHKDESQQWILKETGDGYYYIISKCNYLYLDIEAGQIGNGTNIQMYEGNGTKAQKFKLKNAVQKVEGKKVLEDGVYKINTALDVNKYLDVSAGSYNNGANLQIWDRDNVQQQKFQLKYNESEKCYEIKSVNSGKVLDVQSNGKIDGTNVWQYESNGSDAQKWILKEAENGYYYIIAVNSYLYLDVNAGRTDNGTNIQIYERNGTKAQKFKFEKITMIEPDSYNIEIKQDRKKVLDISAGSTNEGANVQIWDFESVNQQVFKVEYIDNTYCKITAKHSNKVLTVKNGNVVQEENKEIDAQKWSFEIAGNGYYKIKSKENGLYLNVYKNRTENGTNVQVDKVNTSNAQIFKLREIPIKYGIDVSTFNGNINWPEVRKSGQADYAIIRVAYRGYVTGKIVTDDKFVKNVKGAAENGIDIGLYFFTQAINVEEAIEEANYVLNLIKQNNVNVKYPIVIDSEYSGSKTDGKNDYQGRADKLDVQTRTEICKAFCETIRNAGYIPAVYANVDWFYNNLDVNQLSNYDIWVAHYTGSISKPTNYKYSYNMWQYTSSGSIPGVYAPVENGKINVDMNVCYKNY